MATPLERALTSKTLVVLLQALTGRETTVELRNECIVRGTVEKVDCYMNVDLAKATVSTPFGDFRAELDQLFVKGQQIRYVHVPDDVDMVEAIRRGIAALANTKSRPEGRDLSALVRKTQRLREKIVRDREAKQRGRARGVGRAASVAPEAVVSDSGTIFSGTLGGRDGARV